MRQLAFINGVTLKTIREDKGVSAVYLAKKAGLSKNLLAQWESGSSNDYPTMRQAEKMAKVLRVPLAGLYLNPENYPKNGHPPFVNLRRFAEVNALDDSALNLAVCQLASLRSKLLELRYDLGEESCGISLPPLDPDPVQAAECLRSVLDVSVDDQMRLSSSRKLFKLLRRKLEVLGVLLVEFTGVEVEECRGVALYYDEFAIAGVNANDRWTARCFSTIHELGHLSRRFSAACNQMDLNADSSEEVYCNALAGNYLIPGYALGRVLGRHTPSSLEEINGIATLFCASREVVVRRLLDLGYIDRAKYEELAKELKRQVEEEKAKRKFEQSTEGSKTSFARNPIQIAVDVHGTAYVDAVRGCLDAGSLNEIDASGLLGVPPSKLEKVFLEAM